MTGLNNKVSWGREISLLSFLSETVAVMFLAVCVIKVSFDRTCKTFFSAILVCAVYTQSTAELSTRGIQVSGSTDPHTSGPFWRCVKQHNAKMKVQQEESALQLAETAAVEAAEAAEELPEVEKAVQLYVAQLQSVHAKRQRLLKDVVDKAEEILAGKIEREGAALKEVTGRYRTLPALGTGKVCRAQRRDSVTITAAHSRRCLSTRHLLLVGVRFAFAIFASVENGHAVVWYQRRCGATGSSQAGLESPHCSGNGCCRIGPWKCGIQENPPDIVSGRFLGCCTSPRSRGGGRWEARDVSAETLEK